MKKRGKWAALFCAGMMAASFLTGCGTADGSEDAADQPEAKKENTGTADTEKSMGRYLEKEITMPEEVLTMAFYPMGYLQKSENDELILGEQVAGRYISSDHGESWESAGCPWTDILPRTSYISDMVFSPDGALALICSYTSQEEEGNSGEEDTEADGASAEEKETDGTVVGIDDEGEGAAKLDFGIEWHYFYYDAEGNPTEIDFSETGGWIRSFWFDRQGRLYACVSGGKVYRIDPAEGTKKELFEAEGTADFICCTEKYLVAFTVGGTVVVYDLEADILAEEDKVLQDFIRENLGQSIGNSDMGHTVIAAAGEQEDIIYFAFSGGLYRHVIGGTAIEQVIDGATSSFGDPSMTLMNMVMLPDNEFVVFYNGMKLYRYTYDPDVPTVPDKQLKVYSLTENYSMRQAVSLFQKAHQDVYVRYEIGMSSGDGVTREDAIRNLNTKIMSGEGPDILVLDGLPQASYEEKGILADMSGVIDGLSGDEALFPNVVEACRKDGKIYALPIRIQIPMMAGGTEYVQKIKDINSLADAVEEMRAENPEGLILGLKSEEQLLYVLSLTCSAAWTDENGNIDEKALEEFLTEAKRIWQAEVSGVEEDQLEDEMYFSSEFSGEGRYYATASANAISIAMKEQQFTVGKVYRLDFDYNTLTSIAALEEDFGFGFWEGQISGGFIPDGMAGVSANSAEEELAAEFYRFLFGRELQDMDLSGGLPVNMASFDTFAENPRAGLAGEDESVSGSIGISTESGDLFALEVKWAAEEEFRKLKDIVSSVSRISSGDATIEQAVYEIGPRALDGSISPREAVEEIVKKAAIYLAE